MPCQNPKLALFRGNKIISLEYLLCLEYFSEKREVTAYSYFEDKSLNSYVLARAHTHVLASMGLLKISSIEGRRGKLMVKITPKGIAFLKFIKKYGN